MPGYNNSVIVRHGNYLTVYSNLSQVYVKAGDRVSTRQAIGRIYSDPEDGNSTLLHQRRRRLGRCRRPEWVIQRIERALNEKITIGIIRLLQWAF